MRLNLRLKFGDITFFGMISKTQTLKGVTSTANRKEHLHYIFWDLEGCTLNEAEQTLKDVQKDFCLSNIYITSDLDKSYRAWCFSQRKWLEYLHILLHTQYVDYGFWIWTIRRGEATLRISKKDKRSYQNLISVLEGYYEVDLPQKINIIMYDTGIEKRGRLITNYR